MKTYYSTLFVLLILFSPVVVWAQDTTSTEWQQNIISALTDRFNYLNWRINGRSLEDQLSAKSFIIAEIDSNLETENLLSRGYFDRRPIASITKLMTAVIAQEQMDPNQEVVLNNRMLAPYGHSPALFLGARVTVDDLIKASLIQSTNDASEAIALSYQQGDFIGLMNTKAKELGMNSTAFHDAHGLSAANRSTADDLLKLMVYISDRHPEMWELTTEEGFQLPSPLGKSLTFKNLNNLSRSSYFVGGKTGYLPEAGQNYVSVFNIQGRTFMVTLLNSENRKLDMTYIIDWLQTLPEQRSDQDLLSLVSLFDQR